MGLFDVIQYDGADNQEWVLYRYPGQNITTGSQLVVREGQSAVLVQEGIVADVFGPGKYELTTDNLPILNKIVNLPYGGKTPFPAVIYFVNTGARLSFSWGTPAPIQAADSVTGERFLVRAFGRIDFQAADEMTVFLEAMSSMEKDGRIDVDKIKEFFRAMVQVKVKQGITQMFREGGKSAFENPDSMQDLSDCILGLIAPEMEQYGFIVTDFRIQNVNVEQDRRLFGSRRCLKCGKTMQDDFSYCPYCGTRL